MDGGMETTFSQGQDGKSEIIIFLHILFAFSLQIRQKELKKGDRKRNLFLMSNEVHLKCIRASPSFRTDAE